MNQPQSKPKSNYKTLGCIRESSDRPGQFYATLQNQDRTAESGKVYPAHGTLFFQDKETGDVYKVNSMYLFEVDTSTPGGARSFQAGVRFNISVNLNNSKGVELVQAGPGSNNQDTATPDDEYSVD